MSFYATLSGQVICPDQTAFNALINQLFEGGWIRDNQIIGEDDEPVNADQHVFPVSLEIIIPFAYYRNLTRVDFFRHPETAGWIKGTSTDGVETCWVDGPPDVAVPEMPLGLFGDADEEPKGDLNDADVLSERLDWLDQASLSFHEASMSDIEQTAREHFGKSDLLIKGVDMFEFSRLMEHLKRLAAQTGDPDSREASPLEHVMVLLALSEKQKSPPKAD